MRGALRRYGARAAVAGTAGLLLVAASCSALVDRDDAQCSVDGDCERFPGTQCVLGGCVPSSQDAGSDAPIVTPCTSTQDCLPLHGGANWICRHVDHTCVSLLSDECKTVAGQYTSDEVVLLGAIFPLFGPHASTGTALSNAVQLAIDDFSNGLPPLTDGGLPRPVAAVICDESDNADLAATHLETDLAVPLIIGTGESDTTLEILHDVVSQTGGALMSPRATVDLSSYTSRGLTWRTCPSDTLEGAAIGELVQQLAGTIVAARDSSATGVNIAIVRATDVESTQLDAEINLLLAPAGDAGALGSLIDVTFGDPDDPSSTDEPNYADAIASVTADLPDIVIVLGSTQAVPNVVGGIETNWASIVNQKPYPQYVLSSGLQTSELAALVGASTVSLRTRVLGTAAGANAATYPDLQRFLISYRTMFPEGGPPETFGVAQAYDALYATAYAASVTHNTDLDGTDIARELQRVLSIEDGGPQPTKVDVGPDGIPSALAALADGGTISLNGASAPLVFDTQTGDVSTDIQVWCLISGGSSSPPTFQSSGLSLSWQTMLLQGSISAMCQN